MIISQTDFIFGFMALAIIVLGRKYTVVKVGDSTILQCSVSPPDDCVVWIHHRLGASHHRNHEDQEVYDCDSGVNTQFRKRFHVDRNVNTGKADLHIKHVVKEDAGTYECQDLHGYGKRHSTELFVIDGDPICEPSVSLPMVNRPNYDGIPPNEILLTCSVTYSGPKNSQPILKWRRVGDNQTLHETCDITNHQLSCTVRLRETRDLTRASYFCTTTQSATSQYSCTTEAINIILLAEEHESFRGGPKYTMRNYPDDPVSTNPSARSEASSGPTKLATSSSFMLIIVLGSDMC